MSTPAERQRRRRERLARAGIDSVTVEIPAGSTAALRQLAAYLCDNRDHALLPAIRLPNGRYKFLKG